MPQRPHQKRYVIGIDPGLKGAIAVLDRAQNQVIRLHDFPLTVTKERVAKRGKKVRTVRHEAPNYAALASLLSLWESNAIAILEHVNSFNMGRQSAFNFGENVGAYKAILTANAIPTINIEANKWKPALKLDRNKANSIELAKRVAPEIGDRIYLKKHDGRAEAVLLVHWYETAGKFRQQPSLAS